MNKVFWTLVVMGAAFLLSPDNFRTDNLEGLRVLISCASSELGEQLAYQYCKLKARVVLVSPDADRLERVTDKCVSVFGAKSAYGVPGDLSVGQNRKRIVDEATKLLGGKMDTLILNHGDLFAASWMGTRQNFTSLENVMNVNFVSHVDLASLCLPLLRNSDSGGSIGVVSSLAGKVPVPLMTAYSASKAALTGFFSSLRQELLREKSRLSVTTVVLGFMPSDSSLQPGSKYVPFFDSLLVAPAEDCAFAILRSVALRKYEVTYPLMAQVQRTIYNLLPDIYEYNMHYLSS